MTVLYGYSASMLFKNASHAVGLLPDTRAISLGVPDPCKRSIP